MPAWKLSPREKAEREFQLALDEVSRLRCEPIEIIKSHIPKITDEDLARRLKKARSSRNFARVFGFIILPLFISPLGWWVAKSIQSHKFVAVFAVCWALVLLGYFVFHLQMQVIRLERFILDTLEERLEFANKHNSSPDYPMD